MMRLATTQPSSADVPSWEDPIFWQEPTVFDSPDIHPTEPGVRALFIEGPAFSGRPTRVFAWIGLPEHAQESKVPGIVLIHGGNGTAMEWWVKMWMDRGYAAIAMDTCGALPVPAQADPRPRHAHSGPAGWGDFAGIAKPWTDQWPYHAVGAGLLAHSLLRAQDNVDPERIGVTGISWGGFLTCILAGVDDRLRFAIPVYGCGFLGETVFDHYLHADIPDGRSQWLRWWDPSRFLPAAKVPMLWMNGANDAFFFPEPWQKSHRLTDPSRRTLALIPGFGHGQEVGTRRDEPVAFAESIVRTGEPLPAILSDERRGKVVTVHFQSVRPPERAELVFTRDHIKPWPERQWESALASLSGNRAAVCLPPGTRFYFVNIIDHRGLVVSTEFHSL